MGRFSLGIHPTLSLVVAPDRPPVRTRLSSEQQRCGRSRLPNQRNVWLTWSTTECARRRHVSNTDINTPWPARPPPSGSRPTPCGSPPPGGSPARPSSWSARSAGRTRTRTTAQNGSTGASPGSRTRAPPAVTDQLQQAVVERFPMRVKLVVGPRPRAYPLRQWIASVNSATTCRGNRTAPRVALASRSRARRSTWATHCWWIAPSNRSYQANPSWLRTPDQSGRSPDPKHRHCVSSRWRRRWPGHRPRREARPDALPTRHPVSSAAICSDRRTSSTTSW